MESISILVCCAYPAIDSSLNKSYVTGIASLPSELKDNYGEIWKLDEQFQGIFFFRSHGSSLRKYLFYNL